VPCVDIASLTASRLQRRAALRHLFPGSVLALSLVLSACQAPQPEKPRAPDAPATSSRPADASSQSPSAPRRAEVHLPSPQTPRNWGEARAQAARRLVAANPDGTYLGKPPGLLLAIPVMTVELNGDGSVRNISVVRYPSQARDTVNLAIQAIHRAAPFGDVSRLPKPWRFNETFLFNDERKFKPMTLDLP
jgi:hypothetical protein